MRSAYSHLDLGRLVSDTRHFLAREAAELTGANSEPVKKSARILLKQIRLSLNVAGVRSAPAPAGSPPHKISGKLRKSFATAVVDGARRVGSGYFKARLAEFGSEQQPPRPYMRASFAKAEPEMVDTFVSDLQHAVAQRGVR